jgi:predicted DNA-binding transcriptional regulator YafY
MMRDPQEQLTVAKAADGYPFARDAARRHLRAIADAIPGVVKVSEHPEAWQFSGAAKHAPKASVVSALAAARALLAQFRDAGIGAHLEELLHDYRNRVPDAPPVTDLSRMFFSVARSTDAHGLDGAVIDTVSRAILASREITAEYVHFEGDPDEVRLRPYTLVVADEGVYCLGEVVEARRRHAGQRRLFNLRRMARVRLGSESFNFPLREDYDPAAVFRHCFGEFLPTDDEEPVKVVLRFAPRWRGYLSRHRVHRTQEIIDATNAEIRLDVYLNYDLVRWIRGHGNDVEVLEPDALRERVKSGAGAEGKPR